MVDKIELIMFDYSNHIVYTNEDFARDGGGVGGTWIWFDGDMQSKNLEKTHATYTHFLETKNPFLWVMYGKYTGKYPFILDLVDIFENTHLYCIFCGYF